jgi:hypothetical protein
LQVLCTVAEGWHERDSEDFPWGRRKRGERVLHITHGALVEMRSRDGRTTPAHTATGQVVVTDQRILFAGAKKREWPFSKLVGDVRHTGADITLIEVSTRVHPSGFSAPGDEERTRLMVELAVAGSRGRDTSALVQRQGALLASHERQRPVRPGLPV